MQSKKSDSKWGGIGRAGRGGRRGYVLFWFAAVIILILAFAGLVVDVGYLEYYKRKAQTAADAGAIGAIQEMLHRGTTAVRTAAADDVTANGFTNDVNGATVVVNNPPASGPHVADAHYVEVIVGKTLPTTFMRVLSFNNMAVRARAVGVSGDSPYCIVALNPSMAGALNVWGNTSVDTRYCGVVVDSTSPQALTVGGSGCIVASEIDVVGNYSATCAAPTPNPNSMFLADPLAGLDEPVVGLGCDHTNLVVNRETTLYPGVYCGGIRMVANGYTLTLTPGMYILNGGGFTSTGGASIVGNGITFYLTARNGQQFDPFRMNGNVSFNLTAPTSGPYEGIILFQDRAITRTDNDIVGTPTSTINGLIYMPAGGLTFSGNSSSSGYLNIVADNITFSGNSRLGNDYSTLENGNPIRIASLVE